MQTSYFLGLRASSARNIELTAIRHSKNVTKGNAKLDEVLKGIGEINKRMDKLDQRLDNVETCLNDIEHTFNKRIVNIEKQLTNEIDACLMAEIEKRIVILENKEEDRQAKAVMKES